MFPRIGYLEWVFEHHGTVEWTLGDSNLAVGEFVTGRTEGPNDVVPPLLADVAPTTDETTLEALVADEYGVPADHVLLTAGATHANFLAIAGLLEDAPEGPIAVERPGYEPLHRTARALGADLARLDREPSAPIEHDIEPADVPAGGSLVITNRHNPTGHRRSRGDLARVAEVVHDGGGRLLVDEVYAPFEAEPTPGTGTAFGGPTAAGLPGVVVTGSLTKFFGLGGLRIGWIVADPAFLECCLPAFAHTPVVSHPSRALGRRALANADDIANRARDLAGANHERLASFVAERGDLSGTVAAGSPVAFLYHETADGDRVVETAMDHGVLVTPGRFFGEPGSVRVALGRPPAHVETALERFGEALDSL